MYEITEKKDYFEELTFRHLTVCLKSYDAGELFSSAIWGAVFSEALLKDILLELTGKNIDNELGGLIQKINGRLKDESLFSAQGDIKLLKDIANRCDEIRMKRNRLVHDTGTERSDIQQDADDINNNVIQISKQYLKTSFAKNKMKSHAPSDNKEKAAHKTPDFPIFISSITPHTFEQAEFINLFCDKLREIGVNPVRCEFDDFDRKDPMGKVRGVIAQCNAVIVIGLERSHVYYYKDKEGSPEEKENIHRKYTSGWLQLESGIAIGMNKDIFILCQKDIHSDGIFDRGWNSYTPVDLEAPLDVDSKNVKKMLQNIEKYISEYNKNKKEASV